MQALAELVRSIKIIQVLQWLEDSMSIWPYGYFETKSLSPAQQALFEQLQTMQAQAGEHDLLFAFAALRSQQGVERIRQEADEVGEYIGCILCGLQVEHDPGECQYWALSGKSSVGFNSDDVSGRALLFKKGKHQWIELHYAYLQDAQVVQLSRLELEYPASVHVGPDKTTYPGAYVCVSLYKDEKHWPEWRAEEAEKREIWQRHCTRKHEERMRQLEAAPAQPDAPEAPYKLPNPQVHILRDRG